MARGIFLLVFLCTLLACTLIASQLGGTTARLRALSLQSQSIELPPEFPAAVSQTRARAEQLLTTLNQLEMQTNSLQGPNQVSINPDTFVRASTAHYANMRDQMNNPHFQAWFSSRDILWTFPYLSWRCPFPNKLTRVAGFDDERAFLDGSKLACMPTSMPSKCLVYSFGSNNDFKFERAIEHYGCEIHVFDCTSEPPSQPIAKLSFHKWCLGTRKHDTGHVFNFTDVVRMLGHESRRLEILKMDIESHEWEVFPEMFRNEALPPLYPKQFLVEIHDVWGTKMARPRDWKFAKQFMDLFLRLDEAGYDVFSREYTDPDCQEYSMFLLDGFGPS